MTTPEIFHYDTLGSTNDEAARLLAADCATPLVVIARRQTKGRGRFGRPWLSESNGNLYISFGFRPRVAPARLQTFTLWMGVVLCDFLAATLECGGRAKRRHRFGRFTSAVLHAPFKAVSPVADAPFVLLPARCAGARSEAPLRFASGPRLRRDHLRAVALRATALQKSASSLNGYPVRDFARHKSVRLRFTWAGRPRHLQTHGLAARATADIAASKITGTTANQFEKDCSWFPLGRDWGIGWEFRRCRR